MAGNFQEQFSSELFDNSFSVFTSDDNNTEESRKEEDDDDDANDKEIVIEETVVSGVPEQEFITLEEMADSDFIRSRQVAAKSIVEYLHQAGSNKEALHSVISVMCKLSEDEDLIVRSELIEQIPSIALFCKEHPEDLGVVIRQQIVPYTVKLLTDIQRQIRKHGHSTLLVLLENNVIDHSQLSEWICPLIAQLVTSENIPEELRLEDVSVMCKMIPFVGKEITEKFFLEPFLSICRDSASSAREVCMLNFGTISQIIGRETTEKTLLCTFLDLCQESWHVKTKCVDIAIDLATTVSSTTRNEILSPVYISLLRGPSVAVSHAAYLSLGRFISTFAEPSKTGLKYIDGMWVSTPEENANSEDILQSDQHDQGHYFEFLTSGIISKPEFLEECSFKNFNRTFDHDSNELPHVLPSSNFYNCKLQFEGSETYESSIYSSSETFCDTVFISNSRNFEEINSSSKLSDVPNSQNNNAKSSAISPLNTSSKEKHIKFYTYYQNTYNNFQFWRLPLPEVDLDFEECKPANLSVYLEEENSHSISQELAVDLDFDECKPTNLKVDLEEENSHSICQELASLIFSHKNSKEPDILKDTDDCKLEEEDRDSPYLKAQFSRARYIKKNIGNIHIMPNRQVSLNKKQMTDTEKMVYDQDLVPPQLLMEFINDFTVNRNDLKGNLTFYFPSVAYALGRKHWPCIRDLFNAMSSTIQFVIRKTVASSLHELAVILGPEITTEDLLPVFLKLLRNVDIRYSSSLMRNASKILKITKPQARRQFLPLIEEICSWDKDDHNWRYRLTVSEQLILCVELFSSHEALHFLPASLLIMQDKISAVRRSGVELLAVIVKSIVKNPKSSTFLKAILCALDEKYRKSKKWLWRQFYVFICQDLAAKRSLPAEFYVEEIIPNLFSLAWDAVPNVRLAVARCLALTLLPLDFLPSIKNVHFKLLLQVVYSLQSDVDKDVRHFGHLSVATSGVFKSDVLSQEEESSGSLFKECDGEE